MAGGTCAWLAGLLLILVLEASALFRISLAVLWTASSVAGLRGQWRGMSRICRIVMTADGRVEGIAADGQRRRLELLSGSIVLERFAWLRLRFPDGSESGEWLRRGAGEAAQWRRLKLLWWQRAGFFGRSQGS